MLLNCYKTIEVALKLVLTLSVFCIGVAQAANQESLSALKEFASRVQLKTLSNGLRVIVYQRGVAPVFAGVVTVRVGGVDETPGSTGISHMLEHMAFKGTPTIGTKNFKREKVLLAELEMIAKESNAGQNLDPAQKQRWGVIQEELSTIWDKGAFDRAYQGRGAVGLNASTGKELTNYYVNFPRSSFEFWAWMESERILNPVMRQFYRERDVVMEERRMRYGDNPSGKLYEQMLGVAFLAHPYRNPVIGYETDLKKLLASSVQEFHSRYYIAQNIVVAVVGDVDFERDLAVLEKYFGRIPSGKVPERTQLEEPVQRGARLLTLNDRASPELAVAYKKPNYPHPEDASISVMLEILAGSRISPIYTELVKRRQIAANMSYFEAPGNAHPNLMIFTGSVKAPRSNTELLRHFDEVIEGFKKQPVTDKQLEIAKRAMAVAYISGMNSNLAVASDLTSSEIIYGDWKHMIKWFDQIMAVTKEDVQRAAQTYLKPESRIVARLEKQ